MSFPTILESLSRWAVEQPSKNVWTFLDDKGEPNDSFTYFELDRVTSSLANDLLSKGLKVGDRAMLVFFPGLNFMVALLACFKAGIIAVPVFPPDPRRLKKDLHHFISIQKSSGSVFALTHSEYNYATKMASLTSMFSSSANTWPKMNWVLVDDTIKISKGRASNPNNSPPPALPQPAISDIAFLQYTSGSTSEPKGVMISHGNLAHNLTLIIREIRADMTTIEVSWLPQYHDMGLIGSYLGCLYCGGIGYYLSPLSFLKDPTVWMRSISRYKGTHTQAPNFAYALSVRKFKDALRDEAKSPALQLSTVQHMINAAEPVDVAAITDFYATYGPYGLPTGVVVPTYGLAEQTVFVCSGGSLVVTVEKDALEQDTINIVRESMLTDLVVSSEAAVDSSSLHTIVSCGVPSNGEGIDVLIVGTTTGCVVDSNKVGEIWVRSPSKAMGYWGKPELTEEDFKATVRLSSPEEVAHSSIDYGSLFLKTGDLGFMYKDQLFICGRMKDLIIVRGSNHYPQDIEKTAEGSSNYLRPGCSAAFAIKHEESHTEAVVYVAELRDSVPKGELSKIADNIRQVISSEHGLGLSCICLIEFKSVEKTTSGKIARSKNKAKFLEGSLKIVYRSDSKDASVASTIPIDDGINNVEGRAGSTGSEPCDVDALIGPSEKFTLEQVRSMTVEEIAAKLEIALVDVTTHSPDPQALGLDYGQALTEIVDSMTLAQFKGVLEKRFFCNIPDEFMFTEICNLNELAQAVKLGTLTKEQKDAVETGKIVTEDENGNKTTQMIEVHKEPCCPWFYWCY